MTPAPRTLRDDQARTVSAIQQALVANDSVLATAPTGAGKCHPAGTLLLMYDGTVKDVAHIRTADRLMGPDSRPKTVLSTSAGYGPIVKIVPKRGEPWRCNDQHILTLADSRRPDCAARDRVHPANLTDISVTDYLHKPPAWRRAHQLVRAGPIEFQEPDARRDERSIHPYVLGADIASQHADAVQPTPRIPHPYRTAPRDQRTQLLAGLIDRHGQSSPDRYVYPSAPRPLADDIAFVARSLGLDAQISPDAPDEQASCSVVIRGKIDHVASQHTPATDPVAPPTPNRCTPFQILPDGEEPYYGFTLDGDGRYLLADCTITHNTVMFSDIIRRARLKDYQCDVIVHREELLKQSVNAIRIQTGEEPGVIWRDRQEWDAPIRVITHGSLQSRPELPAGVRRPHLLNLDEAHHAAAPGWVHAIRLLDPKWLIGWSATPFRHDRHPLVPEPFALTIRLITPADLIKAGHLVPPVVVSPLLSDNNGNPQQIGKAANLPAIYLQAVRHALSRDRSKIILYVSGTPSDTPSAVSVKTRDLLHRHGIPAAVIHEGSSSRQREQAQTAFQSRTTAVLINYMTLTEGFDATDVDCVILGRNTRSESTLIQMIGRGLRIHPGKTDCLILDFTGRQDVHDIINYWRLDDEELKAASGESEPRKREPTEHDLDRLQTAFPDILSTMDHHRALYPWLLPYHKRRLRALRLWQPDDQAQSTDYLCVEPTPRHRWKLWKVRVAGQHHPRVSRVAQFGLSTSDAANAVHDQIGELAPVLRRDAPWRRQPASVAQRRRWRVVHDAPPPDDITRGDAADALALQHFRAHVTSALL